MQSEYEEYLREGKISLDKFNAMMKRKYNLQTNKEVAEKTVQIIMDNICPRKLTKHNSS